MTDSQQQFCLRWNNFQANITSQFEALRDDEDFVDVTFACDGRRLQAHKVVLSACSPYFKELFKTNPCKHPIIFMRDVEFEHLQSLLEFMYAGEVNISQAELPTFLRTAESLQIRGLTDSQNSQHNNEKYSKTSNNHTSNGRGLTSPSFDDERSKTPPTSSPPPLKRLCKRSDSPHNSSPVPPVPTGTTDAPRSRPVIEPQVQLECYKDLDVVEPKVELPEYGSDDECSTKPEVNALPSGFLSLDGGMEVLPSYPSSYLEASTTHKNWRSDTETANSEDELISDSDVQSDYLPENNLSESSDEMDDNDYHDSDHIASCFYGQNKFMWSTNPTFRCKPSPSHNSVVTMPGLKGPACELDDKADEFSMWNLLFTNDIIEDIVFNTNLKIVQRREAYKNQNASNIQNTDALEIKAFIGLLIYSSIFKSKNESVPSLFATDGTGRDIFRATMSRQRFTFLMDCLRFDGSEIKSEKIRDDPAALISSLLSKFMHNSQNNFSLGMNVCIDEMFVPFKGKCKFRVYAPLKATNYGIKICMMTDARNSYAYDGYICCGKGEENSELREFQKPTQMVLQLVRSIEWSNRNVTADDWFSSIELVNELKKRGITYVGAIRKNKKEIPRKFLQYEMRPVGSSLYGYTGDMTLLSYVPKKREVSIIISSMHYSAPDNSTNVPEMVEFYNSTRSAVDILEEKSINHFNNRKTRRWSMAVFQAILGMSCVNAHVLFTYLRYNTKISRFDFNKNLAFSLVKPFIERREITHVPKDLRSLVCKMTNTTEAQQTYNDKLEKKKRCYLCPSIKNRKTFNKCCICQKPICLQCARKICRNCLEDS